MGRKLEALAITTRLISGRNECGGFAERASGKEGERSRSKSRRSQDVGPRFVLPSLDVRCICLQRQTNYARYFHLKVFPFLQFFRF